MILTPAASIAGRKIEKTLGLVCGCAVRAAHLGNDTVAGVKNAMGGEIEEYTKILGEAREQALGRMVEQARALGADAVTDLRFATSEIEHGAAEILVYGNAVVTESQ